MDLRPYVEKITCPVLVLGGADDPLIPARLVSELADTLGEQASCHLLDDCGHLLWRDQGEQAYSIMREFVLAQAHLQPTQTPTGERFA
jgi:proline iminopeptidase